MPKSTLGNEEMITAEEIMITTECEEFINNHINRRTSSDEPKPDVIVVHDNDSSDSGSDNCWMMIDKLIFLYNTDEDVLKSKTMWLNDTHITCAQTLLEHQFPQYGGLQCTVLQQTKSLKSLPAESLQILHTRSNHWIAVSTVNCTKEDITVYDSKYSRLSSDTENAARTVSSHRQICRIRQYS